MASRSDTVRHSGPEALRPLMLPPPFRDPLPSPQLGGFWVFLHPWRRLWHPDQERPPSRASPLERHKRSVRPSLPMGRNRHQAPGGLKHNDRLPSGPHGHKVPGGQPFDSSSSKRLPMEPPPTAEDKGVPWRGSQISPGLSLLPFLEPMEASPSLELEQPLLCPHPRPPGQRRPPQCQPQCQLERILPWQEVGRAQKPPFSPPRKEPKLQRKGFCSCSGSPSLALPIPPAQQGLMAQAAE